MDQLPDRDADVEEFLNAAQAQVNLVGEPNGSQTQEFASNSIDPAAASAAAPVSHEVLSLNSPIPAAPDKRTKKTKSKLALRFTAMTLLNQQFNEEWFYLISNAQVAIISMRES